MSMRPLFLPLGLLPLGSLALGNDKDLGRIKEQHVQSRVKSTPSEGRTESLLQTLRPDGTWPNVDYKDRNQSSWKTSNHVHWIEALAEAYCKPVLSNES